MTLQHLKDAAARTAAQHADMSEAFAEERAANASAILAALRAAAPALRALSSPIPGFESPRGVVGVHVGTAGAGTRMLYAAPVDGADAILVEAVVERRPGEQPRVVSSGCIDLGEAARRYRGESVAASLLGACVRQEEGNGPRRTEQARRRTALLRALVTLIESADDRGRR